jgi:N-acetylmuramoyl-L-alanine amidase
MKIVMSKIRSIKSLKVPLTLAFLACFVIVAVTANNRANSVLAVAGADGRPVVVIDAGHGAYALT